MGTRGVTLLLFEESSAIDVLPRVGLSLWFSRAGRDFGGIEGFFVLVTIGFFIFQNEQPHSSSQKYVKQW